MLREPVVAGQFYTADPTTLKQQVSTYINQAEKVTSNVKAIISPHAGYIYSGQVTGCSYKQVQDEEYDTVIVLSPSHHIWEETASIYSIGNYKTPLGEIETDTELCKKLQSSSRKISCIPELHEREHALEVQLPFLQVIFPNKLRIIPIVMSGDPHISSILAKSIINHSKDTKTLIVASSDLSHFHNYSTAKNKDLALLKAITSLDIQTVTAKTSTREWEMCGQLPVLTIMHLSQHYGWNDIKLLDYKNSGDTSGDHSRVVGYAAMSFA